MYTSASSVEQKMVAQGLDNSTDNSRMAHVFNPKPNPMWGGGKHNYSNFIKTFFMQKEILKN